MLGAALPGFKSCNPTWLRLSKKTLGPYATKTKFTLPAGVQPLPPLLLPAWPLEHGWIVNDG